MLEFMLKCAPEKSEGFKTEPFEMSISTERGCSSGSEKAKPREREREKESLLHWEKESLLHYKDVDT